jgi:transposase-like protein
MPKSPSYAQHPHSCAQAAQKTFTELLKLIWQAPNKKLAGKQAKELAEHYGEKYPKVD